MSENASSMDRLSGLLSENRISVDKDSVDTTSNIAQVELDMLPKTIEVQGDNSEKANHPIPAQDLNAEFLALLKRDTTITEEAASSALENWDKLGVLATEKLNATGQLEGLAVCEQVETQHTKVINLRDKLAASIQDHIDADKTRLTYGKIGLHWEDFATKAGIPIEVVKRDGAVKMLKEDPRFADYRQALVDRMAEISAEQQTDSGVKNLWAKLKLRAWVGFKPQTIENFNDDIDSVRTYQTEASKLSTLPDLADTKEFRSIHAKFMDDAGWAVNNQEILNYLEPMGKEMIAEQEGVEKALRDSANIEAYTDLDTQRLKEAEETRQREDNEVKEAALRVQAEGVQLAKESIARAELADLELQAVQLRETALKHEELASLGLHALVELQHSQEATARFNQMVESGQLPESLHNIITSDIGVELDEFIRTGGKKGSVEAVRKLIGSSANMGELEKVVFDPNNPDGFLTLNTLQEDAHPDRVVETGITVELAEDGTWQFRFATRQGGKIETNQEIPVINLKPENIFASLSTIDAQEASLTQAKEALATNQRRLESAEAIKSTTPEMRRRRKAAVSVSEGQVEALSASLLRSKAELAQELKVTNANVTLGKAFEQMTEAQQEVAAKFYSADFREMVGDLAEELGMDADKITADVLATLVVEANHTSEQAGIMVDYLHLAGAGGVEAAVIEKRLPEIDALAAELADLKHQQSIVAELTDGPAKDKAVKEHTKAEKALNKRANEFGQLLNQDFIDAIPAPLRKGVGAVKLSDSQFKKQATAVLAEVGFDTSKYLKRDAAVAMRVRASLPYTSELQSLFRHASDALVEIDNFGPTPTLLKALEGGDVEGFLSKAKSLLESSTERQLGTLQTEVNARRLAEILSTPEGILEAMKSGELYWQTAVDKVMNGEAPTMPVLEGLRAMPEPEVRLEAARRFQVQLAQIIRDAGGPDVWTDGDPLAGKSDLAAQIKFADEFTDGANHSYWATILDRVTAEKKTTVAAE